MLRRVIATVLALCVPLAIGCAKNTSAPVPASGGKSQATTTVPANEANAKVNTTVPFPMSFYESADVGPSVKQDGSIDQKSDDFAPSDHLRISVKSSQMPKGLAANLVITSPEKKSVVESRVEFAPATGRAVFAVDDLTKWKPGLYDIEVTMEGDVVFKHGIHIIGKASAKQNKPKSR